MPSGKRRHIVIVGAGFGGLNAAKSLRKADVDVTIIDKTNHHLFQPLLYQVATAALSPGDTDINVLLVEGGSRLLPAFDKSLSARAKLDLEKLGATVRLDTRVTNVDDNGVTLADGTLVRSRNVIWAAGNAASPLLALAGLPCDEQGRAYVASDCSVPGFDNVFVIGDAAHFESEDGAMLPGVAQVAIQQGTFVAGLLGKYHAARPRPLFQYNDKGSMATIGRAKAVAQIKRLKLTGFFAWMMWALIHITFLIGFRNRIKVLVEWLWYYVSFQPGARLITRSGAEREVQSWLGRQSKVKLDKSG